MKLEKITLRKTCSFYISDFHLTTLLLPYITNKIEENSEIKTFLEESIVENMNKVVTGLNINKNIKNKILCIDWNKFDLIKYNKVIEKLNINNNNINIIVNGKKQYIENVNKNLEKMIEILNAKGLKNKISVTINNCYQVREVLSVKEILDKHDRILNTSGEVEISSVFEDYKKVSNL